MSCDFNKNNMVRKIFLLTLLIFPFLLNAQSVEILDKENGFRNFIIGSSIKNYPKLKFIEKDKFDFKKYFLQNDNLNFEEIRFNKIIYSFHSDILYEIILEVGNFIDSEAIKEYLVSKYGEPSLRLYKFNEMSWFGKKITLRYYNDSTYGTAKIIISSKAFFDKK